MAKQYLKFQDDISVFRSKFSCNYVLLKLTDQWRQALDRKQICGTILMDLSKAFNCMPHCLLLSKRMAYGMSYGATTLFASYLLGRWHRVKIGCAYSSWATVLKGVLGQMLFNLFINDIFSFFKE